MVELSEAKRRSYAERVPVFWRQAKDAHQRQKPYFESLLGKPSVIALVAEGAGGIEGFLVAFVTPAPPVYDPGGLAVTIDDFCVASPGLWPTAGKALLAEASRLAKEAGAAVVVVVCGEHDAA